jgi:Holliday junction DNA helicase RuvA
MINYIEGYVKQIENQSILVITTGGIGFDILCITNYIRSITINSQVSLFIESFLIQETSFLYYGFVYNEEKQLFLEFKKNTSVNKKSIMNILDKGIDSITNAIFNKDILFFSSITGIGKKTAENLINEMKDNKFLSNLSIDKNTYSSTLTYEEARFTLVNMGYNPKKTNDTLKIIIDGNKDISIEELIKEAIIKII